MRVFGKIRQVLQQCRQVNNIKGSSSVLVILIMITLVVLGLLAMMSTYSGLKLSRKNAEWTQRYYQLDAKAEKLVAGIDVCLADAESAAERYISSKEYEKRSSSLVSDNIQNVVYSAWQKASETGNPDKFTDQLYKKMYYLFAVQALNETSNEALKIESKTDFLSDTEIYSVDQTVPDERVVDVSTIVTEEDGKDGRSLDIRMDIRCNGLRSTGEEDRYQITSWKELPKKFEYKDSLDFENLEVE